MILGYKHRRDMREKKKLRELPFTVEVEREAQAGLHVCQLGWVDL